MKDQSSWEMRCTVFGVFILNSIFGCLLSVAPLVLIDGLGLYIYINILLFFLFPSFSLGIFKALWKSLATSVEV